MRSKSTIWEPTRFSEPCSNCVHTSAKCVLADSTDTNSRTGSVHAGAVAHEHKAEGLVEGGPHVHAVAEGLEAHLRIRRKVLDALRAQPAPVRVLTWHLSGWVGRRE